jgi:hypothetical protein
LTGIRQQYPPVFQVAGTKSPNLKRPRGPLMNMETPRPVPTGLGPRGKLGDFLRCRRSGTFRDRGYEAGAFALPPSVATCRLPEGPRS